MGSAEPEIPKTCKACCVVNSGPNWSVSVEEVPVPEPGPGQLLIRLNATGLCHTDIIYMSGGLPVSMDDFGVRSPGHEGAGVVVKLGTNVKDWKLGDRAGVKPVWTVCFNCELCWSGREMYCKKNNATGLRVPGTYQQYILSPARYTTRIPDGVNDYTAGPIMCSGTTVYRSLIQSDLQVGDWAVFSGAGGGVGHFGIQIAKAMGFRIIAIDTGEAKKKLCEELGADAFVDYCEAGSVAEEVMKITSNLGAHAVFVAAGSPAAYKIAPSLLRVGGRMMCIGQPPFGSAIAGADPNLMITKNLSVIGTMVGTMLETEKVLGLAAKGLVNVTCEVFSVSDFPKAVEKLHSGDVTGRLVVDFNA